jgi:uncharacterized protein YdeI (YjbR/CyaY-like superfamily)
MTPIFFADQTGFRKWLMKNHKKETELLVGFYKKESGKANMSWSQSVDEALCFGWIDGVRRSIDKESYCIRFTPRRPSSTWSTVNINKVEVLMKQGLMQQAGIEIYNSRKVEKSGVASYENETKQLDKNLLIRFKENIIAWEFFNIQAPSYQKTIVHWIMTAKQEKTKLERLKKIINESEKQKRIIW